MTGMPAASATMAQLRYERVRVGGHLTAGVGAGRLAGPADAAVVEADHAEARGHEIVYLVGPAVQVIADAVDQDQGLRAVPADPVVDLRRVGADETAGHRGRHLRSPSRPGARPAIRSGPGSGGTSRRTAPGQLGSARRAPPARVPPRS